MTFSSVLLFRQKAEVQLKIPQPLGYLVVVTICVTNGLLTSRKRKILISCSQTRNDDFLSKSEIKAIL